MPTIRHQFELQGSTQTLEEGLVEYFAAHPGLKRDADLLSTEAREFFRSHDVVHVLYGCGTSMPEEAIVKLASLFGTTGGRHVLRGYTHHEALDIYRHLPIAGTLAALMAAPFLILRTVWRCKHQTRPWPWKGFEPYLQVPLVEVRRQFGITVARGRG
jgi:hypothetical protein